MDNLQKTTTEISTTLEGEIITMKQQLRVRSSEVVITALALAVGVGLFCFNLVSFWGLFIILFGAMWNFFTESNKFFACVMAFLMCVVYGFVAGGMKMFGHAFLHLMFYLPTQLIYYYESDRKDNSISHTKKLTQTGYIGTVVCGWVMAFGLGIVLFKVGDPYYILDALSTTLLIISVFLVNGKYKAYFPVRIVAVLFAISTWLVVAIKTSFSSDALIFVLLFIMYLIVDIIKFVRWKRNDSRII